MNQTGMDERDLEEDAAMECNEFTKDSCCIRVAILIKFYFQWIYHDSHKVSLSEIFRNLNNFSLVQLLNDYCHIKQNYSNQTQYLRLFFLQQCDIDCDISLCIMLLRCNRDRVKMS